MASEGGKIKSKKRQAPSKPYDRNLTLLGKFKQSVKELLIPSWLSSSIHQNERHGTGDACQTTQVSSSSVEVNSISSNTQIQNKAGDGLVTCEQASSSSDSTKEQFENALVLTGQDRDTSAFAESHINRRSTGKLPSVKISAERHDDLISRRQDMLPTSSLKRGHAQGPAQTNSGPERLQMSQSLVQDSEDQSSETVGVHSIMTSTRVLNQSLNASQAAKRQKLWSPEPGSGRQLASPLKEKPTFNSALLGSMSDSSMFGDSFQTSLFYQGKTRFGGASAERRTLNTSLPYQSSLPLRKQVKAHNTSNSIQAATTSATAQRILETLDRMSTPLGDAKKIPVGESLNDSVLTFTPTSYRRTTMQSNRPVTRPLQLPSRGPPTSQHQALTQAVIAKNRQQSRIIDKRQTSILLDADSDDVDNRNVTSVTSQESATPASVPQDLRLSQGQQSGATGKMKVKRLSQHISNTGADDDQVAEIPNLRTDFTLPISNMNPIQLKSASIPLTSQSVPQQFVFSAPIDVKQNIHNHVSDTTSKSFRFTSPVKTSQTKASAAGAEDELRSCQEPAVGASSGVPAWTSPSAFNSSVPAWSSAATKLKTSPDIGGTSSSFKSYSKWSGSDKQDNSSAASDTAGGFSLAPAASLKQGSVMDILGGGKVSTNTPTPVTSTSAPSKAATLPATDNLMAKFVKPAGSWSCETCMIVNKPDVTKCVCCDTAKPGAKSVQSNSSILTVSSNITVPSTSVCDTFKKPETVKAGTDQQQNGTGISPGNSLSSLFKKPAGSWECDTCLVQNTAGAIRCIACDSSKPGLEAAGIVPKASISSGSSSSITISPAGGFTFNVSATTTTSGSGGFKFGSANSAAAPSTSVPAATGFVFGQTLSANKDSSNNSTLGSSTTLSGGFKFGAAGQVTDSGGTSVSSGSGFVFGNLSSSTLPAKTVVGGFKFGETVQTSNSDSSSASVPTVINNQTEVKSNGISSTTDLSKFNSFVSTSTGGFQLNSVPNTNSTASLSSTIPQPLGLVSTDSSNKVTQQQVSFSFNPPSCTAQTSFGTTHKLDSSIAKPVSGLFQFNASSVVPSAGTGLGMGKSLSDSKPIVNGGFGSGFGVQALKNDTKPASVGNFTFGTTTSVFGGFGQDTTLISLPTSDTVISQATQSSKRSVDVGDVDHSSSKKPFNFGTGIGESTSNGPFVFSGGSSESKAPSFAISSATGPSAGGFTFNSTSNPVTTQTSGPAPGGGFQFSMSSPATPAFQGFNFSLQAQNEALRPSFEANKGPVALSATPNFNFGSVNQQSSVFQFGAKPIENSSPSVFTFGSTNPPSASTDGPTFGALPTTVPVGSFSIGTGDSGRKMKKAIRRIKK